ncbi:MAG: HAD family hydrolase [Actinomycetota bacterium]
MRALQAVVFDLDDTLFPERDFVLSGFRAVAHWAEPRLGVPAERGFGELTALFESGVRGDTFARWLKGHGGGDPSLESVMVEVYRSHQPRLSPRPGAPELLRRLKERYLLGLVTDGPVPVQRAKLEALGLRERFDAVVFSDELGGGATRKPNPLPFNTVLDLLGAPGGRAVYVADNPAKDFLGARRAGMLSIRFRADDGIYRMLEPQTVEHAPDEEIGSLLELTRTLSRIQSGATPVRGRL